MKILVLDANIGYLNPTRIFLPYIFKTLGSVSFFGPGFTGREELAAGLPAFIEKHGPFDIAIHTEQALPRRVWESAASRFDKDVFEFYFSGNVASFSSKELAHFWSEISAAFKLIPLNVLSLLLWDYQGTTDSDLDYIVGMFGLVLGLGHEHWDQAAINKNSRLFGYNATSNWSALLEKNRHKVHSMVHFIAPQEFCFDEHSCRPVEWSVLGVSYEARKAAKSSLEEASIDVESGRGLRHFFDAARYKIGYPAKMTKERLTKLNSSFLGALHNSKYSFTCGSSFRMPIRKFFEIPAAGAILVCDPCHGLEALGFVDGVNCIVAQPKELPDVDADLRQNPEKAKAIACRGQELILKAHTLDARSRQICDGLDLLIKGEFYGSYWEAGELKYKDSEGSQKVKG